MGSARVCDLTPDVADLPPDLTGPLPPRRRVRLALEILAAYCWIRRLLFRNHFSTVLAGMRDPSGVRDVSPPDAAVLRVTYLRAARLARAVQRTLKFVPADGRCLMQALVLTALLARRGIDTKLLIGVNQGDEFQAHSWVEYSGYALLPDSQGIYHVLAEL
jgi:hypothetical protein